MVNTERVIFNEGDVSLYKQRIAGELIHLRGLLARREGYLDKDQILAAEQSWVFAERSERNIKNLMNDLRQNTWGGV